MAVAAGFGLIVLFEAQFGGEVFPSRILFGYIETPKWDFPGGEVVFNAFAAGGAVATALAVRWLWAVGDAAGRRETVVLMLRLALQALIALGRHEGPRLRLRIYHLVEGFVPR